MEAIEVHDKWWALQRIENACKNAGITEVLAYFTAMWNHSDDDEDLPSYEEWMKQRRLNEPNRDSIIALRSL